MSGTIYAPDGQTGVIGAEVSARDEETGDVLGRALTDSYGAYVLVVP